MYPCRLMTAIGKQMQYTMLFDGRTTAASSGCGAGQLIKCIYTLYVHSVVLSNLRLTAVFNFTWNLLLRPWSC